MSVKRKSTVPDFFLGPVYMEVGGPQIGEVTCDESPHLSCKRDEIKMRD